MFSLNGHVGPGEHKVGWRETMGDDLADSELSWLEYVHGLYRRWTL